MTTNAASGGEFDPERLNPTINSKKTFTAKDAKKKLSGWNV
jgi:hypothetical protein